MRRAKETTGIGSAIALAGALAYSVALAAGNAYGQSFGGGIEASAECALSNDARAAIEAATVGDVAAMKPVGEARTLSDRLLFRETKPGVNLSGLSFTNAAGEAVTLGQIGSGPKLLNLWATWCAPCRAEMPLLAELAETSDAFEVVALSVDAGDMEKSAAFLDEIGVDLPLYHEGTMRAFTGLREAGIAVGLPVTALVGSDGCVLAAMNGPAEWAGPDARALMDVAVGLER